MYRLNFKLKCLVASLLLNLGFSSLSLSQQDPMLSHYVISPNVYNPAVDAYKKSVTCFSSLYHNQWLGFGGEGLTDVIYSGKPPQTQIFNMFHSFDKTNAFIENFSVQATRDVIGYQYSNHMMFGTSKIKYFGQSSFSYGIMVGFVDKGIDGNWLPPETLNDVNIPQKRVNDIIFDASLGLHYTFRNYFASTSMTHLPRGKFDWGTGDYVFRRHLYVSAGRFFYPNNQNYVLQSSVLLKSDFTKEQFDINLTATYINKFWGGITVRDGSSLAMLIGMKPGKNIRIGYSSDFNLSRMKPYQNGTHEFFIELCFPHKIIPEHIIWPVRYLNGDKDPRLAR